MSPTVGPGRVSWSVEGPDAAELLQCGCSLDLDFTIFGARRCARTLLASVGVVILRPSDELKYEVVSDRSLAAYLQTWLDDAAAGFAQ